MVLISPDPPLLEFIKCGSHSFWVSLLLVCLTNEFRYTTLSLNCKVIIQVKPCLRYTRMVVVPAMHAVYAKAEKVGFARTQTLGTGGSKYDFRFYKK